jgi:hypothetical protein
VIGSCALGFAGRGPGRAHRRVSYRVARSCCVWHERVAALVPLARERLVPRTDLPAALDGVTATSARSAWAVGSYCTITCAVQNTLILHWNGTRWLKVPSPDPSARLNSLDGVSATWELWNGSSWQQLPVPPGMSAGLMDWWVRARLRMALLARKSGLGGRGHGRARGCGQFAMAWHQRGERSARPKRSDPRNVRGRLAGMTSKSELIPRRRALSWYLGIVGGSAITAAVAALAGGMPVTAAAASAPASGGSWSWPRELSAPRDFAGGGEFTALSCASRSDCTAVGIYQDRSGRQRFFAITERRGVWGKGLGIAE